MAARSPTTTILSSSAKSSASPPQASHSTATATPATTSPAISPSRWLTTDPAGFHDSLNLYQYVLNNPFRYYDPDGQFAFVFTIPLTTALLEAAVAFLAAPVALPVLAAVAVGSVAYIAIATHPEFIDHTMTALHRGVENTLNWSNKLDWQKRKKEGTIDPSLPEDPRADPNLEDISHPEAKERGKKYRFKDKNTGEILEWHEGTPGQPGHRGRDHYHRPNPNTTGDHDKYLDGSRNPVAENSEPSHIYPPS